jgi:hypothetical protein
MGEDFDRFYLPCISISQVSCPLVVYQIIFYNRCLILIIILDKIYIYIYIYRLPLCLLSLSYDTLIGLEK